MGLKTMTMDSIKVTVSDQASSKVKNIIVADSNKVENYHIMGTTSNENDDFIQVGGKKKKEIVKN